MGERRNGISAPFYRKGSVLIGTRKARVADHVRHQDRGQFPGQKPASTMRSDMARFRAIAPWRSRLITERRIALPACRASAVQHGSAPCLGQKTPIFLPRRCG
jgi:hypothetical protein